MCAQPTSESDKEGEADIEDYIRSTAQVRERQWQEHEGAYD